MSSHGPRLIRRLSLKHDPASLADALGLLSPTKTVRSRYKPSLLRNLRDGPVSEQFRDLRREPLPVPQAGPLAGARRSLDSLVADLNAAILPKQPATLPLASEDHVVEAFCVAFFKDALPMLLAMKLLFNRNLVHLERLPFDVRHLDQTAFARHGWTGTSMCEFKILLLKKYHDLGQPLSIVRLLRSDFEPVMLPLIRAHQLLPFYERIAWKFYFEYVGAGQEAATIVELDNLRSSFLIWEASAASHSAAANAILAHHDLLPLQSLFVRLAASRPVAKRVAAELVLGRSPLLSELKKMSAKFKLYKTHADDVFGRALAYSLIHRLELVVSQFPEWEHDAFLKNHMDELVQFRKNMVRDGLVDPEWATLALFTQ